MFGEGLKLGAQTRGQRVIHGPSLFFKDSNILKIATVLGGFERRWLGRGWGKRWEVGVEWMRRR